MIQFVIGAIAGIAAKKYFTKEHVEKIEEAVIDFSVNKIVSHLKPIRHRYVETHVFDTRMEASEALKYLRDTIKKYGHTSINDYYDTFADPDVKFKLFTYMNERYGWFNLDEVAIKHVPDGWIIDLPEPVGIDQFTEGTKGSFPDTIYFNTKDEALEAENDVLRHIAIYGDVSYKYVALKAGYPEEVAALFSDYGWTDADLDDFHTALDELSNRWYITNKEPTKIYENEERTNRHTS